MPAQLKREGNLIYRSHGQTVARRIRVWDDHEGTCFAIVTEDGAGVSITNAAEAVVPAAEAFVREYVNADAKVHVVEHYPDGVGIGDEHYDLVWLDTGDPKWRRLDTYLQEQFLVGLR